MSQRFSQVLNVHVRFRCGASVVYSEGGGVPGLIQREVNPKLLRVHCLSHRCALVLKDSESVEKSGWEAQPREVWVMIRLKASGSASASK